MKTVSTDDKGDIFTDSAGSLAMAEGPAAVGNIVLNRVRTLRGEDVYNTEAGIPYFDVIFCDMPDISLFIFYLLEQIGLTDGVSGVNDIDYTTEDYMGGKKLSYTAEISTKDGGGVTVNG